ncbi:MAG: methylated-DNA--[protein]-cysteine S-methyltransferase [Beduini sp.]|uniref:methylated-DNA--[protein]-cysteine S-methyltransferase n=1 Tax=Beduini sp. TaxID=1922300 RepID=UPI00399F3760
MNHVYYYDFPIGRLAIADNTEAITQISIHDGFDKEEYQLIETPLIKKASLQLSEYFEGKRKNFELPLSPKGTDFQKRCWEVLQTIPYGETWSYKQLAQAIGNEKACRAVGGANNKNPIIIVIPCHRVIGANGQLVGYGGGLPIKKALLTLEREYR